MNAPPEIDGAKVLLTIILNDSHVQTGFTTHYAKGFENLNRLAICKYDEAPEFYLFYCDSDWVVLNDTAHDSKQLAIQQAELEFEGTAGIWVSHG